MSFKDKDNNLKCQDCKLYFYKDRIITKTTDILIPYNKNFKRIKCEGCGSENVLKVDKEFDPEDVPSVGDYSTKNEYNKEKR